MTEGYLVLPGGVLSVLPGALLGVARGASAAASPRLAFAPRAGVGVGVVAGGSVGAAPDAPVGAVPAGFAAPEVPEPCGTATLCVAPALGVGSDGPGWTPSAGRCGRAGSASPRAEPLNAGPVSGESSPGIGTWATSVSAKPAAATEMAATAARTDQTSSRRRAPESSVNTEPESARLPPQEFTLVPAPAPGILSPSGAPQAQTLSLYSQSNNCATLQTSASPPGRSPVCRSPPASPCWLSSALSSP